MAVNRVYNDVNNQVATTFRL